MEQEVNIFNRVRAEQFKLLPPEEQSRWSDDVTKQVASFDKSVYVALEGVSPKLIPRIGLPNV